MIVLSMDEKARAKARIGRLIQALWETVYVNAVELADSFDNRSLSSFAYTARTILEVHVWLNYFKLHPAKANQFVQDTARDITDLTRRANKLVSTPGEKSMSDTISARLQTLLQVSDVSNSEEKFMDVHEAFKVAPSLDLLFYKLLSKCAHITAFPSLRFSAEKDARR